MRNWLVLAIALLGVGSAVVGCGPAEPSMPKDEYAAKSKMTEVATKAFGEKREWDALTAEEKKVFTDFYTDEAKAKESFDKIYKGLAYFAGGGGGPAPAPTTGQ